MEHEGDSDKNYGQSTWNNPKNPGEETKIKGFKEELGLSRSCQYWNGLQYYESWKSEETCSHSNLSDGHWLIVLIVSCFLARFRGQPETGHIWEKDSRL